MGRRERLRGQRYEREIVKRLQLIFGPNIRRGYQSRGGGKDEPDITGEDLPSWVHFEVTHSNVSPWAKLRQAERDTPGGGVRIAVCKRTGGEELAAMRWDDLALLLDCLAHCLDKGHINHVD